VALTLFDPDLTSPCGLLQDRRLLSYLWVAGWAGKTVKTMIFAKALE